MPVFQQKARFQQTELVRGEISALESVRYTSDMLETLRKIAAKQGHGILAHLLELAQTEAKMIVRDHKAEAPVPEPAQIQLTRLPG